MSTQLAIASFTRPRGQNSPGKAHSSRNALKHGLSIPINRDKTLRGQEGCWPGYWCNRKPGMYFGKRGPRPKRSSSSASRSSSIGGGSYARRDYCRVESWGAGTRHCADSRPPRVAEARTLRASGILQTKASATGSLNQHGLRENHMCYCLKLNLGSFCHLMMPLPLSCPSIPRLIRAGE